jgi:hypothetical protein
MNLINKTLHIPSTQYILREDLFMGFLGRRFFEQCEICDFGFKLVPQVSHKSQSIMNEKPE